MNDLELRLPDEILEKVPSGKSDMIKFLSNYFDETIGQYELRLTKRVPGMMGNPLSRYERATIKDFLMDLAIGKLTSNKTE
jgi:hypothetical protein